MQLSNLKWNQPLGVWLALGLGFSVFTPIGISYLMLLGYMGLLAFSPAWRSARAPLPAAWRWILILFIAWPAFTLTLHWHEDGWIRWMHSWRVALCVALALTMTHQERMALLYGFLLGSAWALCVVWVHNFLHPLPEWTIWHQLLRVKGSASSQKWILMAAGAGTCLGLALCLERCAWIMRACLVAMGIALALTVASLSISRNSHLVVMALPLLLLSFRYRSPAWWATGTVVVTVLTWLLLTFSPVVTYRFEKIWLELESLRSEGDFQGSVSVRAYMILTAWQQMWAHPWTGTGLGSWLPIWSEVGQRYPSIAAINNPHNDYLLWGMETGIPGLLLLVALVIKLGLDAWRNFDHPVAIAGWIMTGTLVITAFVNPPFRDAAVGMTLTILAVALSTWPKLTDTEGRSD